MLLTISCCMLVLFFNDSMQTTIASGEDEEFSGLSDYGIKVVLYHCSHTEWNEESDRTFRTDVIHHLNVFCKDHLSDCHLRRWTSNTEFKTQFFRYVDRHPKYEVSTVVLKFIVLYSSSAETTLKHGYHVVPKTTLSQLFKIHSANITGGQGWQIVYYDKSPRFDSVTEFMNIALIPLGLTILFVVALLAKGLLWMTERQLLFCVPSSRRNKPKPARAPSVATIELELTKAPTAAPSAKTDKRPTRPMSKLADTSNSLSELPRIQLAEPKAVEEMPLSVHGDGTTLSVPTGPPVISSKAAMPPTMPVTLQESAEEGGAKTKENFTQTPPVRLIPMAETPRPKSLAGRYPRPARIDSHTSDVDIDSPVLLTINEPPSAASTSIDEDANMPSTSSAVPRKSLIRPFFKQRPKLLASRATVLSPRGLLSPPESHREHRASNPDVRAAPTHGHHRHASPLVRRPSVASTQRRKSIGLLSYLKKEMAAEPRKKRSSGNYSAQRPIVRRNIMPIGVFAMEASMRRQQH